MYTVHLLCLRKSKTLGTNTARLHASHSTLWWFAIRKGAPVLSRLCGVGVFALGLFQKVIQMTWRTTASCQAEHPGSLNFSAYRQGRDRQEPNEGAIPEAQWSDSQTGGGLIWVLSQGVSTQFGKCFRIRNMGKVYFLHPFAPFCQFFAMQICKAFLILVMNP